jgi:hypothetical protein
MKIDTSVANRNKELLWVAIVAILTLVLSSIPNWAGYSAETDKLAYKGAFFDPQDYAVHMSMIRAGMQGDWAYQFRFTTELHTAAYTRLFYIALGQINRLLQLDPAILFEAARWLFGALALFALYALTARVFEELHWRRMAFLLAVFGSGLGWLQLMTGWVPGAITPIDFWLIDAYFFFGLALFPHFSFVTALLCLAFALYLDFLRTANWTRIAWIGALSILVQFVNPIAFALVDVAFAAATLAVWMRDRKFQWRHAAALAALAFAQLPLLFYNYMLLNNDPTWSQFTRQNQTLSPPPVYYLWGFGLLWLFALIGIVSAIRNRKAALIACAAWVVTGLLLAYAPFYIQRRFLHAVTIPLALLGTQGLITLSDFATRKWLLFSRRVHSLALLTVFLVSISSVYIGLGRGLYLRGHPDEFFYPASLNNALTWLQDNATQNDFVLSAAPSGLLIAQKTNLRVYIGHEMETLDYMAKSHLVEDFYQGRAKPDWLATTNVNWVFYGPYEQDLSHGRQVTFPDLEVVYQSEGITIYRSLR